MAQSRKNLFKDTWWWFKCGHVAVFVCYLYVFLHRLCLHTCVGVGHWHWTYGGISLRKTTALIALKRNLCEDIINKDQARNYNWYVTAPSQAPVAILLEAFLCEDAAQTPTPAPAASDPGRAVGHKHRCASGIEAPTRCASGLGRPDAFFSLINCLVLTALPILLITRHAVQPLNVSTATLWLLYEYL